MVTWAFLFKNVNCCFDKNHAETRYHDRRLIVGGVRDDEEAIAVSKKLVQEKGCWLIELCGGFGPEGAKMIADAVGEDIIVGYVDFSPEMREKLDKILKKS